MEPEDNLGPKMGGRGARRTVTEGLRDLPAIVKRDRAVTYPDDVKKPVTRGDCADVPRPCPFVSCKHNLYLDTNASGGVTFNFPDIEPDEMKESCVLDVADRGDHTLEEVGEMFNIVRERVRQIEEKATRKKLRRLRIMKEFAD